MIDNELRLATYQRMRWNTPLSEDHATLLLELMDLGNATRLLDLGCGWGELLLRATAVAGPDVSAVGIDIDAAALDRGRAAAASRGLANVGFIDGPAADWDGQADRVLCVGACHAFGGTVAALAALATKVEPGGRLLYGDTGWTRPPTAQATAIFGDAMEPLAAVVGHARDNGWLVVHESVADQAEWDDFETSWRAGREEWLLANPRDSRAPAVREELDTILAEYVESYRGVLGFSYLVLSRPA